MLSLDYDSGRLIRPMRFAKQRVVRFSLMPLSFPHLINILFAVVICMTLQGCRHAKEFPTTVEEWNDRACEYYDRQEYEKACNDWDQAIMIDHNNAALYWRRARACRQFGRLDQSVDDATKAVELAEGGHDRRKLMYYLHTRAECYATNGELEPALNDFNRAIKMSDGGLDSAPLYMDRGRVLMKLGENKEAVQDFTRAIELVPTWGRAYHFRAKAYDELLDFANGRKDHETALRMGYEESSDRYEPLPIRTK